jgi:Ni/Fe-hydrogenase subunit HybB-like protein
MSDRGRWLKDVLWILVFLGAVAIGFRLWYGLGVTTNLSDAVPWGLWKILNMVAGVAVATGGFTVGFLVYVLKLERFRPLVKPAILIAFLGYGSSVFALVLDIGLPHRIWHPILMWNVHSFLFEVAWCVMLYFTVTMIELSPTVLERFRLQRLAGFLHRIAPGVVIVGIALSSLHHSSLGSLFLVTPLRLHSLWYSPLLPVQFILSAIGAGMMGVALVKILYARHYDPESIFGSPPADRPVAVTCATERAGGGKASDRGPDFPMVRRVAAIAASVLAAYLVLKIVDLSVGGTWRHLLRGSWESWFWAVEVLVAAVLPVVLLAVPRTRNSPVGVGAASLCAVVGLFWNRLNVGVFGYFRDAGEIYVPSLVEWALSLGVIAAAVLAFLYAVENLPIFDTQWKRRRELRLRFSPAFDHVSRVWRAALGRGLDRVSLLAVFTVALGWLAMYPPFYADRRRPAQEISPPAAVDEERSVLRLDANRRGMAVVFPHRDHQQRLGKEASCRNCHHLALPDDHSTPCSRCHRDMERVTDIFDPDVHLASLVEREQLRGWVPHNHVCGSCHDPAEARSASNVKPCLECHRQNMRPTQEPENPHGVRWASGLRPAMHGTCVGCHERERERVRRPDLAECSNCHEELRWRDPDGPEAAVAHQEPSGDPGWPLRSPGPG